MQCFSAAATRALERDGEEGNVEFEQITQIEPQATCACHEPISESLPVIHLDRDLEPIQENFTAETRKGQQHQRSSKERVILRTLGFWSNGQREILG
jgi:hypothetical protein